MAPVVDGMLESIDCQDVLRTEEKEAIKMAKCFVRLVRANV